MQTARDYTAGVAAYGRDFGADGWFSGRLADGRELWLLGDTIRVIGGVKGMVHSAYVMESGGQFGALHANSEVVPNDTNGDQFWVSAVYPVPKTGGITAYVTVDRVRRTGSGVWDFQVLGTELAELWVPTNGIPAYRGNRQLPSSMTYVESHGGNPLDLRVQWGRSFIQNGSYTYVFGNLRINDPLIPGRSVWLARVPTATMFDLSTWQYFVNSSTFRGWSYDPQRATPVYQAVPSGWSANFSVHRYNLRYYAFVKPNDILGDHVSIFTAVYPWGPWTEHVMFSSPAATGTRMEYGPAGHPGLLPNGKWLVSVSRNNQDANATWNNPQANYTPTWTEVSLP